MPKSSRPPETTSTVVAILASMAGGRMRLLVTSSPRRSRRVCAASAESSVHPSKIGPSGSPPIGMRWSNSHACSISGTASASCQTRRRSAYSTCIGAVRIPKLMGDMSAPPAAFRVGVRLA